MRYLAAAITAALTATASPVLANDYPNRPITWVVPFGAGGITDGISRLLGELLAKELGQPVVVENKPGAGGMIGTEFAARAAPDGYTVIYATGGPFTILPNMQKNAPPYDPFNDFTPIRGVSASSQMIVAHPDTPYNTLAELVAYAKANPGAVNFGSPGIGTAQHLVGELFGTTAGVQMTHIPYKAGSNQMVDLMAGVIDVSWEYSQVIGQFVEAGKMKVLGTTGATRQAAFPEAETVTEAGFPGATNIASGWMSAPKGLEPAVLDRLDAAFVTILQDPKWLAYLEQVSQVPLSHIGPTELPGFIRDQSEAYARAITAAGIEKQ